MPRNLQERTAPITRFVRGLDGECMTLPEVARLLRVPPDTLRRWARTEPELFGASFMKFFGDKPIYIYEAKEMGRIGQAVRDRYANRVFGRPQLWRVSESLERNRAYARARGWEARARKLRAIHKITEARELEGQARDLRQRLHRDGLKRRRELGR